ncbi:TIGR02466 family protein [Chelatococcus reniformis]|uniref:2OG-Fe(II) oxygenase-related protein n=1 Tax=Chelatococcus reniformis TaxID=1494448 RepID=A0A916UQ67_9HYPH|nr:TIGR02466 family protein [Chelatococcus reniformis]GGC82495.1 2OG-Fe(II) oxygenase-related protein [Chelatococcus reniformis]
MTIIEHLFATPIYRAELAGDGGPSALVAELDAACRSVAVDDEAGQRWCARNGYPGYTSYASLDDLPWRLPVFGRLVKQIDRHVAAFTKALEFDLSGGKLVCDSLWINVLPPGGVHTSHIHPHAVVSGTFYVAIPPGASALKFEDPRLGFMMAAPPRKRKAAQQNRQFVSIAPAPGTLLLWESWLRHEVPLNEADEERISVSFNYAWKDGGERRRGKGA